MVGFSPNHVMPGRALSGTTDGRTTLPKYVGENA